MGVYGENGGGWRFGEGLPSEVRIGRHASLRHSSNCKKIVDSCDALMHLIKQKQLMGMHCSSKGQHVTNVNVDYQGVLVF